MNKNIDSALSTCLAQCCTAYDLRSILTLWGIPATEKIEVSLCKRNGEEVAYTKLNEACKLNYPGYSEEEKRQAFIDFLNKSEVSFKLISMLSEHTNRISGKPSPGSATPKSDVFQLIVKYGDISSKYEHGIKDQDLFSLMTVNIPFGTVCPWHGGNPPTGPCCSF